MVPMKGVAVLALPAILVVACSGAPATGSGSPVPTSVSTPSPSPAPSGHDITVGGDRPVIVRVPPSYADDHPAPLLIVLHGYSSTGREADGYFGLRALAAEHGYLYVSPDGTLDSRGNRFWNATDACCDFDRSGVDDVGYLDGVIEAIDARLNVDLKRISVVGHSNGGFMTYALACAHADRIAALVSIAGATFAQEADCAPSDPVAVVHVHGAADDSVKFDGGTVEGIGSSPMGPYPGAETTAAAWAKYDGCEPTATQLDERIDVDADVTVGNAEAETTVSRWTGCGSGSAVELWTITGGGHIPNLTGAFSEAVFDFLSAHPKP
jgi:polyhydroxybutyrate depolymerase